MFVRLRANQLCILSNTEHKIHRGMADAGVEDNDIMEFNKDERILYSIEGEEIYCFSIKPDILAVQWVVDYYFEEVDGLEALYLERMKKCS